MNTCSCDIIIKGHPKHVVHRNVGVSSFNSVKYYSTIAKCNTLQHTKLKYVRQGLR